MKLFHTLGSTLQDWGERGDSPSSVRRWPLPWSRQGQQRRPLGWTAASWRMSREGERPLASVQQQHHEDTWWTLWTTATTRGSPANAWLLSSDSASSPWSTGSSSFLDPKKKSCGLQNETKLLCEEVEGNKSTYPEDIPIHRHAWLLPQRRHPSLIPSSRAASKVRKDTCNNQVIGNSSSALKKVYLHYYQQNKNFIIAAQHPARPFF
jgi:hypothetical protein